MYDNDLFERIPLILKLIEYDNDTEIFNDSDVND